MPSTTAETLSLVTRNVSVAPLVLLSAVDHFNRGAATKTRNKRVVGVLLGQNDGKNVRVSNSFAVPFEEDDKDPSVWYLDHNYIESMGDMFKKINAREKLIGWYHSGPKLRASDLEINELFKRYTPNPLLVIIDVQPKESGVPTDAYFAVEEIKDVSCVHSRFLSLSLFLSVPSSDRLSTRTAPPPPRRLSTRPPSSRPRRPRRSASSTCCATSATSPSARYRRASPTSCSPCRACTTASATSRSTSRRSSTASCPSTTPSSATCRTSSTFCRTCLRKLQPRRRRRRRQGLPTAAAPARATSPMP